mmetsp:Transcript_11660/g.31942  ORF Transcript_11660/g.31942 Transcript_11660/m.31942 type:complete len:268 (+) Transcript_11660:2-805(+)
MATVVAIHNNMNERTWRRLMEWEAELHPGTKASAKLLRFRGRPHELTPKARIKTWLGYPVPFDRHDWVVERGEGEEVRYVIDYYYDDELSALDKTPGTADEDSVRSITVDVRPAVDSVGALLDRLRFAPRRFAAAWGAKKPVAAATPAPPAAAAAAGAAHPVPELAAAPESFTPVQRMQTKCAGFAEALKACDSEASCSQAAMALNYCMASVVCPPEAAAFMTAMEAGESEEAAGAAFERMSDCLEHFRDASGSVEAPAAGAAGAAK